MNRSIVVTLAFLAVSELAGQGLGDVVGGWKAADFEYNLAVYPENSNGFRQYVFSDEEVDLIGFTINANGTADVGGFVSNTFFYQGQLHIGVPTGEDQGGGSIVAEYIPLWISANGDKLIRAGYSREPGVDFSGNPISEEDFSIAAGVKSASGLTEADLAGNWALFAQTTLRNEFDDQSDAFIDRHIRVELLVLDAAGTFTVELLEDSEDPLEVGTIENGTWSVTGGNSISVEIGEPEPFLIEAISESRDVMVWVESESESFAPGSTTFSASSSVAIRLASGLQASDVIGHWAVILDGNRFQSFDNQSGPAQFFGAEQARLDAEFRSDGTVWVTGGEVFGIDSEADFNGVANWSIQNIDGVDLVVIQTPDDPEAEEEIELALSAGRDFAVALSRYQDGDSTEFEVLLAVKKLSAAGIEETFDAIAASESTPDASGLDFSVPTETGLKYQLQKSLDFLTWQNLGSPVTGDGSTLNVPVLFEDEKAYFRWILLP